MVLYEGYVNGLGPSAEDVSRPAEVNGPLHEDHDDNLMCRVCRGNEGHLYYPCLCTGSIKYVHQECLTEWLKYSKKEVCELCSYKYSFQPIYRPDMPKALPLKDIVKGLALSAFRFFKTWLLYSTVMIAWLGVVPLVTARIYNTVFYASFTDVLLIPAFFVKSENLFADVVKGSFLLVLFVCTFISLVWLREQIIHGGPQDFINILDGQQVLEEEQPDEDPENEEDDESGFDEEDNEADPEAEEHDDFVEEEREPAHDHGMEHNDPDEFHFAEPANRDGLIAVENNAVNQEVEQPEENWRDWDRLGDELTWQRLLGLDGSFIFLEHVLWVISLNTLFTLLFAYTPYRLGHWILSYMGIQQSIIYFPSLAAILGGYFAISCIIYSVHSVAGYFHWRLMFRMLGICFLVLKVFLLVVLEICLFPMVCGYWIDLCSLSMFSATLSSRIASFASSPTASLFIHWMTGMVFVFYSASFVILLREVLRPGVLWFMRNLNDPDFNPIQEMIELPVQRHMQRIVTSTLLFFSTVFFVIFLPLTIIRHVMPSTLPFHMSVTAETPLSELSLELLILQIILPALLDQTQARSFIKLVVRLWCESVGKLLSLDSYLLPESPLGPHQANAAAPAQAVVEEGGGLAAEHQALLLIREPQPSSRPYVKPAWFGLRICILTALIAVTWTLCSTIFFIVPVNVGRIVVYLCTGLSQVHELYTTAIGLYFIYITSQSVVIAIHWFNNGFDHMKRIIWNYTCLGMRIMLLAVPVVGLIPWMMGRYFQLIFVVPIRMNDQQNALQFHLHDWAMGVLHLKIFVALVMLGPDWWLKINLERIYQDGLPNLNCTRIFVQTILPLLLSIGSLIAAPYIIARLYILLTVASFERAVQVYRILYPTSVVILVIGLFVRWQYTNLKALAEHIRNEKYLVGTQLVNYERSLPSSSDRK